MPIMKFSTDEEAVKLANDSNYGLGYAVFSGSQRRARVIASQIHCPLSSLCLNLLNWLITKCSIFLIFCFSINKLISDRCTRNL
jgi:hypothetical protein